MPVFCFPLPLQRHATANMNCTDLTLSFSSMPQVQRLRDMLAAREAEVAGLEQQVRGLGRGLLH